MSQLAYRSELDGLRAIAVLGAIFFHAGMQWCTGGYVGVEIFFVLSGYLMATIVLGELQQGSFSLRAFYLRRLRRILPAMLVVMLVCLPFAWWLLPPSVMLNFAHSVVAALVFVPKDFIWPGVGYFDFSSDTKPLLHLWSLSAEAQFYVLFPLVVLAFRRAGKWALMVAVLVLGGASFASAQIGSKEGDVLHFYVLSTRAWEMLLGAVIGFYEQWGGKKGAMWLRHVLSLAGLGLIAWTMFTYDSTLPYPSAYTLIPALATAMLIFALSPNMFASRVLGGGWIAGIGLISYSAYLWHQPVFVFARLLELDKQHKLAYWGLTLLVLGMAYLSWKWVEEPFRKRGKVSVRTFCIVMLAGWCALMAAGIAGITTKGFHARYEISQQLIESFNRSPRQKECFDFPQAHTRPDWWCDLGPKEKPVEFIVTGDSHALSLLPAFDVLTKKSGIHGIFAGLSGCPPLLLIHAIRPDAAIKNCHDFNLRVFNYIREHNIKKVYLVARWNLYGIAPEKRESGFRNYLSLTREGELGMAGAPEALRRGEEETFRQYAQLGIRPIVFAQVPRQKFHVQFAYPKAFNRNSAIFRKNLEAMYLTRAENDKNQAETHARMNVYVNAGLINYVILNDAICDEKICPFGTEKQSYYFDDDHLSVAGSLRLVPFIPWP